MQINLHLLRIFFTVAGHRSFSGAARTLRVSQPAVSKGVRELERQLDLPLLERTASGARGVHLTVNGTALFEHARGIFALERAASEDIRARVGLQRGRLAIGASTTVAAYWLPAYAAAFARLFPAIDLKIGVGNTQTVCDALIGCEFDIALVEGTIHDARILATHWRDDELRVIASPDSAVARRRRPSLAELNDNVWLLRERGSGTREVTERLMRTHGISPRRTIEIGSNEGIARGVASGLGVAMLPTCVLGELIVLQQVRPLSFPDEVALVRPLLLLQLKERPPSPLIRALREVLESPPAGCDEAVARVRR
ncbi:MAG TPA: LysR family transcriptional regulator [Steroidobacteraceae bacterium]|jgi:DNA-binding transcriptional LysR family regulator